MFLIWYVILYIINFLISLIYWIISLVSKNKFNHHFKLSSVNTTNNVNSSFSFLYTNFFIFNKVTNFNSFVLIDYLTNKFILNSNLKVFIHLVNSNTQKLKNNYNKTFIKIPFINTSISDNTHAINAFVKQSLNITYNIKFWVSNFFKYNTFKNLINYNISYLRKNKIFNKGRYSRNRQYYRTGVYWCLYINIIAVIGIYFWFFRFTMNFGYLWWMLYLFICSFIIPKTIQFNYWNPLILINNFILNLQWFGLILTNFINSLVNLICFSFSYINKMNLFNAYIDIIILNNYSVLIYIYKIKYILNSILKIK